MRKLLAFLFTFAMSARAQDPTPDFGWQAVSRMTDERYDHCAVSLGDGRVFVTGGMGREGALNTVEVYGPDNSFHPAASMSAARAQHSCTLLDDGRVLVAGGAALASAELFDPVSGVWSSVGGPMLARRGQTATLLSGGRVLLAGGWSDDRPTAAIEIYDPEAERISSVWVALAFPRARHTAALLSNGKVLFIGGTDGSQSLASSEIFDPISGAVIASAPLLQARTGHITATLIDHRVLVAGGTNGLAELASAEVYSESTGQFSLLNAALTIPRQDAFAIVVPGSGLVLIGGGQGGGQALPDTEIFDPGSNQFVVAGALTTPRTRIQGAVLADGVILGTGGQNADGPSNACGVFAAPRLTFTKSQYAFGETALVNGSGFPHLAGQTITLSLSVTDPGGLLGSPIPNRLLTSTVIPDASGQFQASIMTLVTGDAGRTFFVNATQQSLGNIADGSSRTIIVSEKPTASFTGPAIADTVLTFDPLPVSSVAGATIPFFVTLNSSLSTPFNGLVHIRVGPTIKSFAVTNVTPGTKSIFNFCCVDTAGSQAVNVNFGVDPVHVSVTVNGPNHIVVARQVLITVTTSLPLFQQINIPVKVSLPAVLAPIANGTVTLTRQLPGATPQSAPFGPTILAPGLPRVALFPFRATFAEKPTACFTVAYSGDSFYPPNSFTQCLNTAPAVTKLELIGANSYSFNSDYPLQVKLTFPNELGIVNRTVHLEPLGIDVTVTPALGSASGNASLLVPFGLTGITATYSGGTDLSSATASLAFSMNPVPTATILAPIPSPATNPITLSVNVIPNAGRGANTPVIPTGIVQFFDGSLFLGQAALVAQTSNGSGRASLIGVARPVGQRSIKVMYLGDSRFAVSSVTQTITIQ